MNQRRSLKKQLGALFILMVLTLPLYATHESSIILGSSVPSGTGTASISFDIDGVDVWLGDGIMEIDFPTSSPPGAFDFSSITLADAYSPDGSVTGNFTVTLPITGNKVIITRSGGTALVKKPANYRIGLRNLINPGLVGVTGTFTITLKKGDGSFISSDTMDGSAISEPITLKSGGSSSGGGLCLLQSPKKWTFELSFVFLFVDNIAYW